MSLAIRDCGFAFDATDKERAVNALQFDTFDWLSANIANNEVARGVCPCVLKRLWKYFVHFELLWLGDDSNVCGSCREMKRISTSILTISAMIIFSTFHQVTAIDFVNHSAARRTQTTRALLPCFISVELRGDLGRAFYIKLESLVLAVELLHL